MSRIIRYQESIDRFIKTKGYLNLSIENTELLNKFNSYINHYISIILLTIVNLQCTKLNCRYNCYYIASSIDILYILSIISTEYDYYKNMYGNDKLYHLLTEAQIILQLNITQNILSINNQNVIKAFQKCISYIHKNIYNALQIIKIETTEKIQNEVLIHKDITPELLKNYEECKGIKKDVLYDYIYKKYSSICTLALILGWIIGNGTLQSIELLETAGKNLGLIIKILLDFKNLKDDLEKCKKHISTNIILHLGFVNSYIKFIESKINFIEIMLKLNIYNITIKEVIDNIEKEIIEQLNLATLMI